MLYDAGRRLDCCFVIETIGRVKDEETALMGADIPRGKPETIDDLVVKLRKDLEGVTIEKIRENPTGVRIVDSKIPKMKDDLLNRNAHAPNRFSR